MTEAQLRLGVTRELLQTALKVLDEPEAHAEATHRAGMTETERLWRNRWEPCVPSAGACNARRAASLGAPPPDAGPKTPHLRHDDPASGTPDPASPKSAGGPLPIRAVLAELCKCIDDGRMGAAIHAADCLLDLLKEQALLRLGIEQESRVRDAGGKS